VGNSIQYQRGDQGLGDLIAGAPENTRRTWNVMRTQPGPGPGKPNDRHKQLKGSLATRNHKGKELPLWQIEVTSGGRIWYLLDVDNHTVWVQYASSKHPKITE
jgi:hypothetical protein